MNVSIKAQKCSLIGLNYYLTKIESCGCYFDDFNYLELGFERWHCMIDRRGKAIYLGAKLCETGKSAATI